MTKFYLVWSTKIVAEPDPHPLSVSWCKVFDQFTAPSPEQLAGLAKEHPDAPVTNTELIDTGDAEQMTRICSMLAHGRRAQHHARVLAGQTQLMKLARASADKAKQKAAEMIAAKTAARMERNAERAKGEPKPIEADPNAALIVGAKT